MTVVNTVHPFVQLRARYCQLCQQQFNDQQGGNGFAPETSGKAGCNRVKAIGSGHSRVGTLQTKFLVSMIGS